VIAARRAGSLSPASVAIAWVLGNVAVHWLPALPGMHWFVPAALLAMLALRIRILRPVVVAAGAFLYTACVAEQRLESRLEPALGGRDFEVAGWVDAFPGEDAVRTAFSLRVVRAVPEVPRRLGEFRRQDLRGVIAQLATVANDEDAFVFFRFRHDGLSGWVCDSPASCAGAFAIGADTAGGGRRGFGVDAGGHAVEGRDGKRLQIRGEMLHLVQRTHQPVGGVFVDRGQTNHGVRQPGEAAFGPEQLVV
jgi:hypothetical protein